MEKGTSPSLQVEKIRYCITKLDRELRGLDDIKDLKVTELPRVPLISACAVSCPPSLLRLELGFPPGSSEVEPGRLPV